jgi:cytoskeleton protein RodZ
MPTLGEQLKQAREARKLTIKQAVQATRVRSYYIEAMETDDFSAMPSAAQARGFLRLYADFLGLNSDELLASLGTSSAPESDQTVKVSSESIPPQPAPAPEPGCGGMDSDETLTV